MWRNWNPHVPPVRILNDTATSENTGSSSESLTQLPYGPSIRPLSIHLREMTTYVHTNVCAYMFTAALFIIAKKVKINQNVHQMKMDKRKVAYPHHGILFRHKKERAASGEAGPRAAVSGVCSAAETPARGGFVMRVRPGRGCCRVSRLSESEGVVITTRN